MVIIVLAKCGFSLNFVAYGDTRTDSATHRTIVAAIAQESPALVIHVGDLWDGYWAPAFKSIITGPANIAALLNTNRFLVARGNHEAESDVIAFSPTVVRRDSILYSFAEGNCFFVCMGYDPGLNNTWLETQLNSTAARSAVWRIVWAHKPIFSTGSHGGDGTTSEGTSVTNFRLLCDTYGVTLFFSGHDHIYERSDLIYNGAVADASNRIPAQKRGTIYIVTGGGGAPLYPIAPSPPWWRNYGLSTYEYCVLQAGDDSLSATVRKPDRTMVDHFVILRQSTHINAPKPAAVRVSPEWSIRNEELSFTLVDPGKSSLKLCDASGKLMADYSAKCRAMRTGRNSLRLPHSFFTGAIYFFELSDGLHTVSKTLPTPFLERE
jgi:hypothetical protein